MAHRLLTDEENAQYELLTKIVKKSEKEMRIAQARIAVLDKMVALRELEGKL